MSRRAIGTQTDLKHSNYSRVLSLLQRQGLTSKADIAKELGLSIVTVTKVCDSLLELGFCRYSDQLESTGGRRPVGVEFIPHSRLIGVVDLSNEQTIYVALSDLDGNIIRDNTVPIEKNHVETILDWISDRLSRLCGEIGRNWEDLLGCVISIPGVENKKTGEIDVCNIESLIRVRLTARLEKKLNIPVMVENDANLAALGFFKKSSISNLMYLHFTKGIGLGVVVNGQLHTGALGFAGELESFMAPDYRGGRAVLEEIASESGFLQQYRREMAGDCAAAELTDEQLLGQFIEALEGGGELETDLLDLIIRHLGNLISLLIDLFNPEQVILGGEQRFLNLILSGITSYVREHSILSRFSDIEILYGEGDDRLIVAGSASRFFESWLNKLEF